MSTLTKKEEAANYHTFRHIERVRNLLGRVCSCLLKRAEKHDQSKLESPEVELFTELTPILSKLEYNSEEYKESLAKLKPALDHHYANNRHHPEHWPEVNSKEADMIDEHVKTLNEETHSELIAVLKEHAASLRSPINNMNLIDHVEMLCDWTASSERQNDGNIRKSIEKNIGRFGVSRQLKSIYENTVDIFKDGE